MAQSGRIYGRIEGSHQQEDDEDGSSDTESCVYGYHDTVGSDLVVRLASEEDFTRRYTLWYRRDCS
jgi:hypothetical protein